MNPHLVSGAGYGAIYGELGDDDVRSKNEKITITTGDPTISFSDNGIFNQLFCVTFSEGLDGDRPLGSRFVFPGPASLLEPPSHVTLAAAMPQMLVDVNTWLDNLGSSGILNPSRVIQNIIVQLTVRTFGCDEMGNDPKLRDRAFSIIETSDNGHALATFLFPWLPLPKIMSKMWSGVVLYRTLRRIVRARATTGKRGADALQFLLDQGISIISIVEVIFGALFAGVSNSAGVSSWLLYYLSTNPVWMARVRAELIQLGAKYAQASDQQAPLSKQLLSVPLEGWESEVPTLDLCVKETIRMFIQAPFMRKNISREQVVIDKDEVVAPGAIMLFYTAAVMMNPEIYKDPQVWDPARYLPDRAEDKSGQHVWVGWGSGKHPCRGMRFGKLEQNIIAALFIARFDYDLLDTGRSKVQEPLRPSPRAFQFTKPLDFSFSYKAV
ncbi:hypothetical protein FRB98_000063 [Tulasnella sp. 332]|nr:hypothetical protein FRB98_000063 [Tulasnella sp. 332]